MWQAVFKALGWDKVSTDRIYRHRGQSNVVVYEALCRIEKEGLVKRDGTERSAGSRQRILWTWIGERA
jgi:predicted Rossmann fold nucleotide-binding protein DprA/Smf involved in DNA uptake